MNLNPGAHVYDVDLDELDRQDHIPNLQNLTEQVRTHQRQALEMAEEDQGNVQNELLKAAALTDQLEEAATRDETLARNSTFHNEHFRQDSDLRERMVARIDLNNFKAVNSAFGHEGGDRALHLFATMVHGLLYQNFEAVNGQTFEEFTEAYDLFEYGSSFEKPPALSTLFQDTFHGANSPAAVTLHGDEGDIAPPENRQPYNVTFTRPGGDEFCLTIEADQPGELLDESARERFRKLAKTIGETTLRLCGPEEAMQRLGVSDPERQMELALGPLFGGAKTREGGFVGQVSFGVGVTDNRVETMSKEAQSVEDDELRTRLKNSADASRPLVPYRLAEIIADRRCEETKSSQKKAIARRLQSETAFIETLQEQVEQNKPKPSRRTAS